jgi:hypothetical protein
MSEPNMYFKLSINCENDAFAALDAQDAANWSGRREIGRILREVAMRIEEGEPCHKYKNVMDYNGNICGQFVWKQFGDV